MAYDLFFFYSSFSLISPLVSDGKPQSSPLKPQPSLLFHANANDHFHAGVDNHFHADTDADLSLATVFLFFFFFGCGLMGSVSTKVGGFRWARLWVGDVGVGVMSV